MGGRINGVSESRNTAGLADIIPYPQHFGLVSQVYSYGLSPADDLKRVIEGQNSAAAPDGDDPFSSAIGWLLSDDSPISKFLDWFITF